MVDIKTGWNEQNIKKYVKYVAFVKNKTFLIILPSFAICCTIIIAFCLTVFFMFGYVFAVVLSAVILLLAVFCFLFFIFSIRGAVKNILKANAESELNRVMINADDIIAFNNDEPIGAINWNKIADIYFDEKAQTAYLTSEKNAVLILECENILSGTAEELKEIVGAKRNELPKKA